MKNNFKKYLKSIDISKKMITRVEEVLLHYKEICPEIINDIFISEYSEKNDKRQIISLFLFSERFLMEAKDFRSKENYDLLSFRNDINYITVEASNYDLKKANSQSVIDIIVRFSNDISLAARFRASKNNCDILMGLYNKYLITNTV